MARFYLSGSNPHGPLYLTNYFTTGMMGLSVFRKYILTGFGVSESDSLWVSGPFNRTEFEATKRAAEDRGYQFTLKRGDKTETVKVSLPERSVTFKPRDGLPSLRTPVARSFADSHPPPVSVTLVDDSKHLTGYHVTMRASFTSTLLETKLRRLRRVRAELLEEGLVVPAELDEEILRVEKALFAVPEGQWYSGGL